MREKITAWTVVTKEGKEIGSGERGQKYIFWSKTEADEYIARTEKSVANIPEIKKYGLLGWKTRQIVYIL